MCHTCEDISTSLIRSSVPSINSRLELPQWHKAMGPSISIRAPHSRHRARPGVSMMSSTAPTSGVPSAAISKQKRTASGTTPESLPISSSTRLTLASPIRWVIASMTLSVIASSCTARIPSGKYRLNPQSSRFWRAVSRRYREWAQNVWQRSAFRSPRSMEEILLSRRPGTYPALYTIASS